jgi:hypothetical protein
VDQLRLETAVGDRIPAPEVFPLAEQLHEAGMQRVLDTMDEWLRPELIYQLRDGSFNSLYGFCDPFVTGRRRRDDHVDRVEQCLGIGGHCLLFFLEILILRLVVNHRPAIDSASSACPMLASDIQFRRMPFH